MFNPHYYRILRIIGKWKIVDIKTIQECLRANQSRQELNRKILYLIEEGLVKSVKHSFGKKYYYLTANGLMYTQFEEAFDPSENSFLHDVTTSYIVRELLLFENVVNGEIDSFDKSSSFRPDGYIEVLKDDKVFTVALEIELTQKSKKRVLGKFQKYQYYNDIDYVLYISNKERLIETYQRYLLEMNEKVQDKVIFYTDTKLSFNYFEIRNPSKLKFNQKEVEFTKIFGRNLKLLLGKHEYAPNLNFAEIPP